MKTLNTDYNRTVSTSWDSLSFIALSKITWIPTLLTSIALIGFAWWESHGQNFSQSYYAIIVLIVYILVFGGYSFLLLRRANFTRSHIVVIMGFSGLCSGLVIAIGKLFILYRGWALLRLISEPILTALLAAIIGVLVFWRRTHLKS